MYTGIVAGTASVVKVEESPGIRILTVDLDGYCQNLEIGASVSLDGVCMTVVSIEGNEVKFDAIEETLRRTTLSNLGIGGVVNVERSLRLGDEIGGHILSGHVLTTAKILSRVEVGGGLDLIIENPKDCRPFVMKKGFIAIDGMSLTIGDVSDENFSLHIIPETLRVSTIGKKLVGDTVNIEVDSRTQALIETLMKERV